MRNNRKSLGIILVVLGFILLLLLLYITFFSGPKTPPETEPVDTQPVTGQFPPSENLPEPDITPGDRPRNYQLYDISQEPPHQTNQNDLVKTSQAFVERFGSYSNYSNYSNFSDLKLFMTDNMKSWADSHVNELKSASQGVDSYFGVTTKAISSVVQNYNNNAGTARILVTTQRRESTSQVNEGEAYIQTIEVSLRKINGDWLVDSAYWQPR